VKKGSYFGTVMDGKWWRRYRGGGFFARGNGEFWMNDDGIQFRRLLTKEPLAIKWHEARRATLGKSHAGRWAMGRPILKIGFVREGESLEAGFYLSADWDEMGRLADDLNQRFAGR
jgi:hypothetical protein